MSASALGFRGRSPVQALQPGTARRALAQVSRGSYPPSTGGRLVGVGWHTDGPSPARHGAAWLWGAAALVLAARAQAQEPGCQPLDPSRFEQLLVQAAAAISDDDADAHTGVSEELFADASCLTFVPAPQSWAQFLVGYAAVRYLLGDDWQPALSTALQADPEVDRGVGPDHEIAKWVPPTIAPLAKPLPMGAELFLDGVEVDGVPPAAGIHLVQLRTWSGLRSAILVNAPIPLDWFPPPLGTALPAPASQPRAPRRSLRVDLVGGMQRFAQRVDSPGDYAPNAVGIGPEVGASAALVWGGPVGFTLELLGTSAPRVDGAVVATVGSRRIAVGLGGALVTTERLEGATTVRAALAAPTLAGFGWFGNAAAGPTVDLALEGGYVPSLLRGVARIGLASGGRTRRFRAGIEANLRASSYVQPGSVDPGRGLAVSDLSVLASVGLLWGVR